MANKQALALLQKGDVDGFNSWVKQRRKNGKKAIDLDDQNLSGLKLRNVDLRDAHLNGANLRGTDLEGADLRNARLRQADLRKAMRMDAQGRTASKIPVNRFQSVRYGAR